MAKLSENHSAQNASFEDTLYIALDELFTAFGEALEGLSDQQVAAFPFEHHHNIAWITMHTLQNLQFYGSACQGGASPLAVNEELVGRPSYQHREQRFPTADELRRAVETVKWVVLESAKDTVAAHLSKPPARPNKAKPTRGDCYIRTIEHTHTHLRQIWLLRGALQTGGWPLQHWS